MAESINLIFFLIPFCSLFGIDRSGDLSPLDQIQGRRYAEKYRSDPRQIHEIGIVFDPKTRKIDIWEF